MPTQREIDNYNKWLDEPVDFEAPVLTRRQWDLVRIALMENIAGKDSLDVEMIATEIEGWLIDETENNDMGEIQHYVDFVAEKP